MPKISNKGFGFIPVLVLSLLVGVTAFGGYTLYNKENVLPANTQLAQKLPTTNPGKNLIKITLGFNPTPGTYETGKITLKVTSDSAVMGELNADMKKYGLEVQDYCMTAVCPKPRIVRPVITLVGNSYLLVEVPVTPMVKSISFNAYPVNMDPKMPPFSFENNLNGWVPNLTDNNRKISLIRLNNPLNVGIYLRSANSSTGQENYEVFINGIGDDAAELIRSIRTSGVKRIDLVDNRMVTTAIKPNVVYNGQGRFSIVALRNTKTFYASPSRRLNIDFTPMPNGWVKNKNGDGVDRVATNVTITAGAWEAPSYDQNIQFKIESADTAFMDSFRRDGLTLVNVNGSVKNLRFNVPAKATSFTTNVTVNLNTTKSVQFKNLAPSINYYQSDGGSDGYYWVIMKSGNGIERGQKIVKTPDTPIGSVIISEEAWDFPSFDQKLSITINGNAAFMDSFRRDGLTLVNVNGSVKNLKFNVPAKATSFTTRVTVNLNTTKSLQFKNLTPDIKKIQGYDGSGGYYWVIMESGKGIERGTKSTKD